MTKAAVVAQAVLGVAIFSAVTALLIWYLVMAEETPFRPAALGQEAAVPQLAGVTAGILEPCQVLPCEPGLVCDASRAVCVNLPGASCYNYAQCPSGGFCSGVCAAQGSTYGGAQQYCPCFRGYVCVPPGLQGPTLICLGLGGAGCRANADCLSDVCEGFGICSSGYPPGGPCVAPLDCGSGNCSQGYCQPPGVTTGQQGAACIYDVSDYSGPLCAVGLTCTAGKCTSLET
jgi:hypothetical protein